MFFFKISNTYPYKGTLGDFKYNYNDINSSVTLLLIRQFFYISALGAETQVIFLGKAKRQ